MEFYMSYNLFPYWLFYLGFKFKGEEIDCFHSIDNSYERKELSLDF